jgi:radical SAM protein with 4Fe4S-binding SPASM domain
MFAYNEFWNGIVMGMGVELIHRELLDETHRDIRSPLKRRLGSNIYRGMGDRIRILAPEYPFPRPDYRLTLSVPRDRWYINEIIEKSPSLDYAELVRFLDANPLIMRYARQNLDSPQEAGAEKIFVFPDKIQNIQQAGERDADAAYPVSVELTLTNRCNLSCRWCSDSSLRKKTLGDLDFNLVEPLFDDLARHGTRGIVIEGGGEPTIYPRFRDVLEIARERGLSAGLITNGVEMPYEGALDAFEWIRISLDATTSREFLENKGADHFDRVINNIQRLTRHKHRSPLVVGIGFVLTKSNGSRLEELLLNFMKLDVDYIQIRPVIDHPELLPDNLSLDYYKKYSTSDFTIHVHNLSENVIRGNFDVPCRAHSLSSVINANGDVFLCGRLNIYDWIPPVGNLHQNSFHEIWNGEERRRQTAMVFDHDFCRKWCPECRLTKYNILFEKASRIKTRNFI